MAHVLRGPFSFLIRANRADRKAAKARGKWRLPLAPAAPQGVAPPSRCAGLAAAAFAPLQRRRLAVAEG
jgi:hypothetical protein